MSLHVCAPSGFTYRAVSACPACKRRTRWVITTYEWYGPEATCGSCGNHWSDGYRTRQTNKAKAIRRQEFHDRWEAAGTRREMREWLENLLDLNLT